MARTETEQLVVQLEARIRDFEKNMIRASRTAGTEFDKIEKQSKTTAQKIQASMAVGARGVAESLKGLAAPLLALGAAGTIRAVGSIAGEVAAIGDAAKRAGLGIEKFQELKYVAEQNRVGVDALTDGIKELNLRADEFIVTGGGGAADAFKRLGYSAEELNTKLQDPSALFTEIIGKLGQLDRAGAIRIADELFGGSGGEQFVQLIDQGAEGIRRTITEAHNLGAVLSSETIQKADELDRKFNAVATTVGSALKLAIVDAAAALEDFLASLPKTNTEIFTDLTAEAAGFRAEIEQFAQATGRVAPESEADIRAIIKAVDDGALSAEKAGDQLRAMAKIDMTLFPITTSLNILFGQLERIEGKAKDVAAAIATTKMDPIGTGASFGDLSTLGKPATRPGSGTGSGTGGSSAMSETARQAKAVLEQIAALEYERTTIGLNAKELAVANALRQAGTAATDEQRSSIEALVAGNFDLQASQDSVNASLEQLGQIGSDVLGGMLNDLMAGKDAADIFANALSSIGSQLLNSGMTARVGGIFTLDLERAA